MPKVFTAKNNANTEDIINALAKAAPAAIAQAKAANIADIIGLSGGDVIKDATKVGNWIRGNIKYKIDNFANQNIQFPSAILNTRQADCKSISLLYLAIMSAAGYQGGFRFASYRPNGQFTHVYNFFVKPNGIKIPYDACIKGLKESNRATKIRDMKVNYLAGAPIVTDDEQEITRPARIMRDRMGNVILEYMDTGERISGPDAEHIAGIRSLVNKAWKGIKKGAKKVWKGFKKVALAIPRSAALGVMELNFRGVSGQLYRAQKDKKQTDRLKELWNRLGGDFGALQKSIDRGRKRKPLFGGGKAIKGISEPMVNIGIGEPVTLAAAATTAAPILIMIYKFIKSSGVKPEGDEQPPAGDTGLPPIDQSDPTARAIASGRFAPTDPQGEEATAYVRSQGQVFVNSTGQVVARPGGTSNGGLLSGKNLLLLGGGVIAAILLIKKKK
jgi:hypothetical protein